MANKPERKPRGESNSEGSNARSGSLDVSDVLEVIQIDHTTADVMLLDHANRKPLQRPHLTLAIDVASRVLLGFCVSFDPILTEGASDPACNFGGEPDLR